MEYWNWNIASVIIGTVFPSREMSLWFTLKPIDVLHYSGFLSVFTCTKDRKKKDVASMKSWANDLKVLDFTRTAAFSLMNSKCAVVKEEDRRVGTFLIVNTSHIHEPVHNVGACSKYDTERLAPGFPRCLFELLHLLKKSKKIINAFRMWRLALDSSFSSHFPSFLHTFPTL